MWSIKLLTLAAAFVFLEASEECDTPLLQLCEVEDYNFDVPKDKDDLTTLCKNGKQALECAVSYLTKCEANEEGLSKFRELQSRVNEICDEANILFQVIYDNVECISTALTSAYFGCPESVDKGMEKVIIEKGLAPSLEEQESCTASLYLLSCHITHTRKLCGELQSDATLEIFKLLQLPQQCHPDIAAELSTIVEAIEKVSEENDVEN